MIYNNIIIRIYVWEFVRLNNKKNTIFLGQLVTCCQWPSWHASRFEQGSSAQKKNLIWDCLQMAWVWAREILWRLANYSQQMVALKGFLQELSKWMVLTMANTGETTLHERSQSKFAIRNLTKPCNIWKVFCVFLRVVNGNQIIQYLGDSINATPPLKKICKEEAIPVHWNLSWVVYLTASLASYSGFVLVMVLWESTSKRSASIGETIIADVASWKELNSQERWFTSLRARLFKKTISWGWYQDFLWYEKGSCNNSQVLRFITAIFLSMVLLIRLALWYRYIRCYISQVYLTHFSWRIRHHPILDLIIRAETPTLLM